MVDSAVVTVGGDEEPSRVRTSCWFFWLSIALTGWTVALYGAGAWLLIQHGGQERVWGWVAGYPSGAIEILEVDPASPAAARLEVGDRILELEGEARITLLTLPIVQRRIAHLDEYEMVVERRGEALRVELPGPGVETRWRIAGLLSRLIVSLSCFLLGVLVGLADPWRRPARLLALALFCAAPFFLWNAVQGAEPFARGWEVWALRSMLLFHPLHFAFGFHFFASFPEGRRHGRGLRTVIALLYAGGVAIVAARPLRWSMEGSPGLAGTDAGAQLAFWNLHDRLYLAWVLAAIVAIPVVIARNFLRVEDRGLRTRLRWVAFGVVAGMSPFLLTEISILLAPQSQLSDLLSEIAFVAVAVIPPSLAYAVLKHRLMGIEVVVRRGVQYLLARNVLRVALAVPSVVLLYRLVALRERTVAEVLLGRPEVLAALGVVGLSLRFRSTLLEWIDRRFFREHYVQEQVVVGLIEEVRGQPTLDGVARLVSERLAEALHPASSTVLLSRDRRTDLETVFSSTGVAGPTPITRGRRLLAELGDRPEPRDVDAAFRAAVEPEESAWLSEHQVALLVPLHDSEGEILGLIALGEKLSEEPYTPDDRRLLQALGGQVAVTAENLLLRDRVTREAGIRREVLDRLEGGRPTLLRECPSCGRCFDIDGSCPDDGAELLPTLPVGRVLDERYSLETRIGQGGMASVFRARDLRLDRSVAVKILLGRFFGDAVALRRFAREARAVAALSHPNIVAVFDYGTVGPEGAYLVMELVEGTTLRELMRSRGSLTPREVAAILDPLLCCLEVAHQAGLVHRDVKPANVLVAGAAGGAPTVKLGDFGIAKSSLEGDQTVLTATGALVGTVRYMAPEQLTGAAVDRRADLWAVGLVAIEMLTGRHPFDGRDPAQVLAAATTSRLRLGGTDPGTRRLEEVLRRCLAVVAENRYSTAEELRGVLVEALAGCREPVGLVDDAAPPPADFESTVRD